MSSTTTITHETKDTQPLEVDILYTKPIQDRAIGEQDLELLFGLDPSKHHSYHLPVHDVRGREAQFTLDKNGICFRNLASNVDFNDTENIDKLYSKELEPMLKKEFPTATKILFLGSLIRRRPRLPSNTTIDRAKWFSSVKEGHAPAPTVHVDWSPIAPLGLISEFISTELADEIRASERRYIGLSIWKPLSPVKRDPLAYMDAQTISSPMLPGDDNEFIIVPRKGPKGYYFENMLVKASDKVAQHRWYWLSDQQPDELTWIKLCDSKPPPGIVEATPHTSFQLPGTENEETRESIEMRAIIVF